MISPATILVLVHGTFARNAPWTRPNSEFVKALSGVLPDEIVTRQLPWTGRNTVVARREAASRLITEVRFLRAQYANAAIYLIGHSHGGSVIAYATKMSEGLRDSISGCIFLSTPFIAAAVSPRALGNLTAMIGLLFFGFGPLVLGCAFGLSLWSFLPSTHDKLWSGSVVDGIAIGLPLVLGTVLGSIAHRELLQTTETSFGRMGQWLRMQARKSCDFMDTATLPPSLPVLVLRSVADEAAVALAVAQSAGMVARWVGRFFSVPLEICIRRLIQLAKMRCGKLVFCALLAAFVFASTSGTLAWETWESSPRNGNRLLLLLVMPFLQSFAFVEVLGGEFATLILGTILGLQVLAVIVIPIFFGIVATSLIALAGISISSLPFGYFGPISTYCSEYASEPTPIGKNTFVCLGWPNGESTSDSLMHSAIYADPVALALIANWILKERN